MHRKPPLAPAGDVAAVPRLAQRRRSQISGPIRLPARFGLHLRASGCPRPLTGNGSASVRSCRSARSTASRLRPRPTLNLTPTCDSLNVSPTGRCNSENVSSPSMGLALGIDQARVGPVFPGRRAWPFFDKSDDAARRRRFRECDGGAGGAWACSRHVRMLFCKGLSLVSR